MRISVAEAYSGVLAEGVAEGRLDFAVVPSSYEIDEVLLSRAMGEDRECLVCAAGRELPMSKTGVQLRDMGPLRLAVPGAGNARRHRIENYLKVNQIEVAELLELDTMHGTLGLVANSDWVTILPGIICLPDLDGSRRRVVPLADPPLYVDYMRIETRQRPLTPAAQVFADILQEELNSALEIEPISKL